MPRIVALALIVAIASCTSCSTEPPEESAKPAEEVTEAPKKLTETPKEFTNSIGMKFKLIPAGEFMMGSPDSDSRAVDSEKPQHKVRITKPFYLGMYEVTQAEYEKVMGKNPSWFSKGGTYALSVSGKDTSGFPVENVSWDDAVAFCKSLSTKDGKTYRLPSEAKWEYACRAGTTTMWHCGDKEDDLERVAWYRENSDDTTRPVGVKEANAWGLFDMHGNVWEWCQDWYDEDYYAKSPKDAPTGPAAGSHRVDRGGSWGNDAWDCQSSSRNRAHPSNRIIFLGFRVARDPSGK